jgi:DNA end-binding protein Ku
MVSIPVALYPAVQEHDIRFHQIHTKCGSRIKQQKWCPVDEQVVPAEEISRGYEVSKGRYVIVDDEDLEALPVPTKHTITVGSFVDAKQIDPIYFDQPYYLEPEETGKKPYALLLKALESKGVAAVAKIALRQKESLTLLRAAEGRLVLETLHYPDEIRELAHASGNVQVDERELKMAESLVDLLTEPFQPEKYKDEYREALMERIQAKSHGESVREQPETPQAQVIDLFEALKRSLETAKKTTEKPERTRKKAS